MRRYGDTKPRLTREEEQHLAETIQFGLDSDDPEELQKGLEAYQELVEGNMNMAISWAMEYKNKMTGRVNELDDFVQTAMEALCESALKYKPGPVGFGVFCKKIVQNSLSKDRARNAYCICLKDQYFLEIQRLKDRKNGACDYKPFVTDEDAVKKLEIIGAGAVFLDKELNDSKDSGTFGDIIPDPNQKIGNDEEENPEKQKQIKMLHDALDQLTDYEKQLILLRYGFDSEELSYAEIAKRLGGIKPSTMQKRVQNTERKIRKIIGFENWKELPYIKPRVRRNNHEGNH